MKPHVSTDFIKLVEANGTHDPAAFMAFKQELWNEDRTRLTLLMDPGRIKRGVAQNLTLGPALHEGRAYSIVVEDGWPGANGGQESLRFEQQFTVSQALRTLPDTNLWQFQRPRIATRDPLVIEFDRPFDLLLAQTAITVLDQEEQVVPGTVSVENFERRWRFQPEKVWTTETVLIVVDARLEDVAGNNLRELLDRYVDADVGSIDQKTIALDLGPSAGQRGKHVPEVVNGRSACPNIFSKGMFSNESRITGDSENSASC